MWFVALILTIKAYALEPKDIAYPRSYDIFDVHLIKLFNVGGGLKLDECKKLANSFPFKENGDVETNSSNDIYLDKLSKSSPFVIDNNSYLRIYQGEYHYMGKTYPFSGGYIQINSTIRKGLSRIENCEFSFIGRSSAASVK